MASVGVLDREMRAEGWMISPTRLRHFPESTRRRRGVDSYTLNQSTRRRIRVDSKIQGLQPLGNKKRVTTLFERYPFSVFMKKVLFYHLYCFAMIFNDGTVPPFRIFRLFGELALSRTILAFKELAVFFFLNVTVDVF